MVNYHNHILFKIVHTILERLRITYPENYNTIRQIILFKINEEIQKENIQNDKTEIHPKKRKIDDI